MTTKEDHQGVQRSFGKGVIWAAVLALLLVALIYGCARASQDEGGGRQGSRLPIASSPVTHS